MIIRKIGINPYVNVPSGISRAIEKRGYVPVAGTVNGKSMRATLVPIGNGKHRLYINGDMRDRAGVDVGDRIELTLRVDHRPRIVPMPKQLAVRLKKSRTAGEAWKKLTPSRRKEILRYLNFAKHPETLQRNIVKAIAMLTKRGGKKSSLTGIRV